MRPLQGGWASQACFTVSTSQMPLRRPRSMTGANVNGARPAATYACADLHVLLASHSRLYSGAHDSEPLVTLTTADVWVCTPASGFQSGVAHIDACCCRHPNFPKISVVPSPLCHHPPSMYVAMLRYLCLVSPRHHRCTHNDPWPYDTATSSAVCLAFLRRCPLTLIIV